MNPPVRCSNVMTSRRIVVLPEPDGPIRVTRSPFPTSKLSPSRTVLSPNRLFTSSNLRTGTALSPPPWFASAPRAGFPGAGAVYSFGSIAGKAHFQSPEKQGRGVTRGQEDQSGQRDGLEEHEVIRSGCIGRLHHLGHEDDDEERRVLEHRDH